jgi:hypothetical protein
MHSLANAFAQRRQHRCPALSKRLPPKRFLTEWSSSDCGFIMTSKFPNGSKYAGALSDGIPIPVLWSQRKRSGNASSSQAKVISQRLTLWALGVLTRIRVPSVVTARDGCAIAVFSGFPDHPHPRSGSFPDILSVFAQYLTCPLFAATRLSPLARYR